MTVFQRILILQRPASDVEKLVLAQFCQRLAVLTRERKPRFNLLESTQEKLTAGRHFILEFLTLDSPILLLRSDSFASRSLLKSLPWVVNGYRTSVAGHGVRELRGTSEGASKARRCLKVRIPESRWDSFLPLPKCLGGPSPSAARIG